MKHLLLVCLYLFLTLRPAHSSLLLDEQFDYEDGPLTIASAGRWITHGGSSNQIEVVDSQVLLSQSETEDVNAALSGAPWRGPVLYAAFTVSFAALPSGAGAYFAHFKDGTATGFRGRIYSATNGAGAGKFRLGLANGAGAPVFIPTDLSLGTPYQLVLRYDSGAAQSTLWINPTGENSTQDRADAVDAATALSIASFGLRQAVSGSSGMGTLMVDSLKTATSFLEAVDSYDPRLAPPGLSAIEDQSIPANSSTPAVPFVVQDGETAADDLLLTAVTDNPGLVAASGVVFGGGGSNRTVTVTPTPGRQGAARVRVTVQDADGNTAIGTFQVTVGVPSLSRIPDQVTPQGTPTAPIPFSVGDAESDPLVIGVLSTNETLLPQERIHFAGTGAHRTISLTPAPAVNGLSLVTVLVSDGFNLVSNSFVLTVFPTRGTIIVDHFDYPDGSIITNSQFIWRSYGGDTGQTEVVQGQLLLRNTQSEDVQVALADAPYEPEGIWMLYAGFTVRFTGRPASSADYLAHFRGVSSGSGGRVFAASIGTTAVRLGLANNDADPSVNWPVALQTNETYTVVVRFNAATGQSTLWVNPTSETDPAIHATDEPDPFDVWNYAFRQSGGIGTLAVDDLRVGTAFSDVVAGLYRLRIQRIGSAIELAWPLAAQAAGYVLQTSAAIDGAPWETRADPEPINGEFVLQFVPDAGVQFFRLSR